jgi:hypothetical protein
MLTWPKAEKSHYLIPGRLADVTAALQVMAAAERPERAIKDWAHEFDRRRDQQAIDRWTRVFEDHREFFLTYRLRGRDELKAALRWRYVNKLYDAKTGKEYTPEQKEELPEHQQGLLTTKPLPGDQVATLVTTAIALHSRALEELAAARWWVPIIAACLGFIGAVAGAVLAALLGVHK